MEKRKNGTDAEQTTLFDILTASKERLSDMTAAEFDAAIARLRSAKQTAARREAEERRERERQERERIEREERERHEAHIAEVTSMDLPLDWENAFVQDERALGVHAESIPDGLIYSLTNLGRVDIEYISSITGEDCRTVITALRGSIFQNPETWDECFYKGWETSEEYLSGNMMRKWRAAKEADEKYHGYFADNLRAIERVLPPAVATRDIYVTLGSPWVPPEIIDEFMEYLLGDWRKYWSVIGDESVFRTKHDELTGSWEIPYKNRYSYDIKAMRIYGTERINALHILERTLNMKSVSVTDEVSCNTNASGKKRVINQAETVLAIEKQNKMIKAFQDWVWTDAQRREKLETIFENNFSCVRRRTFDGSFLTFPGMSPATELRSYQKNAVARILFTPNTLLAHDVGAGKTYVMIAAGMELRRMELSRKNMFVVPNNIVGQWKSIFETMYPGARLLCVDPKSFTPSRREEMLERIRDENFDGIIIACSCFEQIPLSKEYYRNKLIDEQVQIAENAGKSSKNTSKLRQKKESIAKALSELSETMDKRGSGICFDELGVTRLFVDEAHNFKNVPIETKTDRVLGINASGSKKCQDMMDKVRMVQKMNNGGGVVFATGTPITNSITDAFIIQKYLQNGELAMLELQSFDSWIGMFAERCTEFEIDVDTSNYRLATRFSRFHNLPELTALLASVADFHQADCPDGIPQTDGYTDALISKTDGLAAYLEDISRRAEEVRHGYVDRKEDNMLKITTDGRKAALDLRLVEPGTPFTLQSKAARCAENVISIYNETAALRSTQIVFCDTSTPKSGFNLYDEVKRLLVGGGIPEEEIAFIHDAETESRRNKLFARVRSGEIRVLFGSTFKLGLGVNIQDRLIALHHIDVPWRPADLVQREGRILRQGNTNPKVEIFRYITEGSFDAYSWQLLETKQRFISALLSGSLTERSGSDIEDTVLDYAEVKALAVGDPLIKERVETANELSRLLTLQRKLIESRMRMENELNELPAKISEQERKISECEEDIAFYDEWKKANPPVADNAEKTAEAEKRRSLREFIYGAVMDNVLETKEQTLMNYRGFDIILPVNMTKEKPFIRLSRSGRYYVELGDKELGVLTRIDNYLDGLQKHLETLETNRCRLVEKERQLRRELARNESFGDAIDECRHRLEEIDQRLEAKKK